MTPRGRDSPRSFLILMNIINTITQILLGAVAFSAIFFANLNSSTTSLKQHIYLCVTGYIILMSQAVLSLNRHSGWTSTFNFTEKKNIHWILQILGSSLALAGSGIRIANVTSHFQTAHGVFGILAMIFTALSLIGGVINFFSFNLKVNPSSVKVIHACLGSVTLVLAFLCLIFGFDKQFYRNSNGSINANLAISLAAFALTGVLISPLMSVSRRIF